MADKKISELTELTSPDGTEELVVNDSGVSKKIDINNLYAGSSSKLGIGTSSPDTKLHVEGNILCDAYNNGGAGNGIFFREGFLNTAQPSITLADHSGSHADGLSINAWDGISFRTADTERMRIDSDGNVDLANGISFGGDTTSGSSRYLDDYEEGTWTPTMYVGGSTTGVTYDAQGGSYTKVGRQVTVNGYINLSNNGTGTGSATIRGLPYDIGDTISTTSLEASGTIGYWQNFSSTSTYIRLVGTHNNNFMYIYKDDANQATHSHVINSFECRFTFTYFTA